MSGSGPEAASPRSGLRRAAPYLHLMGLGALAFAQPLFDLLGRHPELFATFLSAAVVVLPGLFLLQPGVRKVLVDRGAEVALHASGARAPVFVLVLDELGLPSLLDESGEIDSRRFPHLAALAGEATWFRDATTVSEYTVRALPALLTGSHPRRGLLPHLRDHPENLFTLLGGDYAVYAEESLTRLCPPEINRLEQPVPPRRVRLASLALDAGVVWLHLTLPRRMADGIPPSTMPGAISQR